MAARDLLGYEVGILSAGFQPYCLLIGGTVTTAMGPDKAVQTLEQELVGRMQAVPAAVVRAQILTNDADEERVEDDGLFVGGSLLSRER